MASFLACALAWALMGRSMVVAVAKSVLLKIVAVGIISSPEEVVIVVITIIEIASMVIVVRHNRMGLAVRARNVKR